MGLRLLCIFAHPDDETLGAGGVLARYANEGVETYLITATRGERGWSGDPDSYPGLKEFGTIREGELRQAAQVLGLHEVILLDYIDSELDQADPPQVITTIAAHIRRIRPQIVLTFGPEGVYGHPDHIAISQFSMAAVVAAASDAKSLAAHKVSKLYTIAESQARLATFEAVVGEIKMEVDGVERRSLCWKDWIITTRIDTTQYWEQVLEALTCHQTQLPQFEKVRDLNPEQQKQIWGVQTFYRMFSLVNGGRQIEADLFEGCR